MNETIALSRLAVLLAQKTGQNEAEAEKFIKLFFTQIENALTVSGDVTVNGLGRFFRQVGASVDFEIEPQLAATINSPFDMFDAIKLPSGIDAETLNMTKTSEIEDKLETETVTETETAHNPYIIDQHINESVADIDDTTMDIEPKSEPEPSTEQKSITKPDTITETESSTETEVNYESDSPKSIVWQFVAVALISMIIGFGIGYLVFKQSDATKMSQGNYAETSMTEYSEDTTTVETNTIESINVDIDSDTIIEESVDEPLSPQVTYDVISSNRFLTTMARQYYGQMEYWAFIYQANSDSLGHPNRITPGTRVVIPSKDSFIIKGETPEQTLARAKKLGSEIYSRYEF